MAHASFKSLLIPLLRIQVGFMQFIVLVVTLCLKWILHCAAILFLLPPQAAVCVDQINPVSQHNSVRHFKSWEHRYFYLALLPLASEPQEFFMLPRHKVYSCILQKGRKHKEQTHRHPDVNGFDIWHLREETGEAWVW